MNEWTIAITVEDVNTGERTTFPPEKHRMSDAVMIAMISPGMNFVINGRKVYMARPSVDFTERTLMFFGEVT